MIVLHQELIRCPLMHLPFLEPTTAVLPNFATRLSSQLRDSTALYARLEKSWEQHIGVMCGYVEPT